MNLTYLRQWAEPDGDNDQLFGVRMEVQSLIRAYERDQEKLGRYQTALDLIACPARPDGTYNRDRRACELLAKQALNNE